MQTYKELNILPRNKNNIFDIFVLSIKIMRDCMANHK